ncbi:hypothetical protein LXM25_28355 [Dyadobacter sp. LJ53]|uniref:hypothetical protein n=1 Tax=Dyadobacter chenwenxiniae TaxID=2906456 RepID=UPI001F4476A7|nr:hypothetical protein [Dyadobacter chenwenxiniae]MCF0054019.1 hypothetical protein [Dyadobacter chenwenxiniae]
MKNAGRASKGYYMPPAFRIFRSIDIATNITCLRHCAFPDLLTLLPILYASALARQQYHMPMAIHQQQRKSQSDVILVAKKRRAIF